MLSASGKFTNGFGIPSFICIPRQKHIFINIIITVTRKNTKIKKIKKLPNCLIIYYVIETYKKYVKYEISLDFSHMSPPELFSITVPYFF